MHAARRTFQMSMMAKPILVLQIWLVICLSGLYRVLTLLQLPPSQIHELDDCVQKKKAYRVPRGTRDGETDNEVASDDSEDEAYPTYDSDFALDSDWTSDHEDDTANAFEEADEESDNEI
jgi:hypothetical protein